MSYSKMVNVTAAFTVKPGPGAEPEPETPTGSELLTVEELNQTHCGTVRVKLAANATR